MWRITSTCRNVNTLTARMGGDLVSRLRTSSATTHTHRAVARQERRLGGHKRVAQGAAVIKAGRGSQRTAEPYPRFDPGSQAAGFRRFRSHRITAPSCDKTAPARWARPPIASLRPAAIWNWIRKPALAARRRGKPNLGFRIFHRAPPSEYGLIAWTSSLSSLTICFKFAISASFCWRLSSSLRYRASAFCILTSTFWFNP
jgi:hypothetical protein